MLPAPVGCFTMGSRVPMLPNAVLQSQAALWNGLRNAPLARALHLLALLVEHGGLDAKRA